MDSRLELIKNMVLPGSCVADIGTDHGHLIVELVSSGTAQTGFACDINRLPLEKAKTAIAEAGLAHKIKPLLCDGLSGLEGYNPDHIVIAGMGGELISAILERSPSFRNHKNIRYILQPMTKPERLRVYLYTKGYEILEESCATEGKFTYTVILAVFTGKETVPTTRQRFLGGITRFDTEDKVLYAKRTAERLNKKINGMSKSGQEMPELSRLVQEIEEQLREDAPHG